MSKTIAQKCKIEGCNKQGWLNKNGKQYFSRDYCTHHYYKHLSYGDALAQGRIIHNLSKSPTANSYWSMMQRCYYEKHNRYYRYGARGIGVCERWVSKGGFLRFYEDMGEKPLGSSIDRVDNNADYSPENCRWSTSTQQASNRSTSINVLLDGAKMCLTQACREVGVKSGTGWYRYKNNKEIHPRIVVVNEL